MKKQRPASAAPVAFWDGSTRKDRRIPEERIWKTKEGKEIPYSSIDPGHLLNILLWMRRRSQEKAADAAHKDGARLGPDGWRARKAPEFDGLYEEALRRGGKIAELAAKINTREDYSDHNLKRSASKLRLDR